MESVGMLLVIVTGWTTGEVAARKARDRTRWFLFGLLLPFVALPWALLMGGRPEA